MRYQKKNGVPISCAFGHLGKRLWSDISEGKFTKICKLIGNEASLAEINDGFCDKYKQENPKQRVLAFLIDKIKEKEGSTFNG
jgi:hypothetical protein